MWNNIGLQIETGEAPQLGWLDRYPVVAPPFVRIHSRMVSVPSRSSSKASPHSKKLRLHHP